MPGLSWPGIELSNFKTLLQEHASLYGNTSYADINTSLAWLWEASKLTCLCVFRNGGHAKETDEDVVGGGRKRGRVRGRARDWADVFSQEGELYSPMTGQAGVLSWWQGRHSLCYKSMKLTFEGRKKTTKRCFKMTTVCMIYKGL